MEDILFPLREESCDVECPEVLRGSSHRVMPQNEFRAVFGRIHIKMRLLREGEDGAGWGMG